MFNNLLGYQMHLKSCLSPTGYSTIFHEAWLSQFRSDCIPALDCCLGPNTLHFLLIIGKLVMSETQHHLLVLLMPKFPLYFYKGL
jgi:hypothetical protein